MSASGRPADPRARALQIENDFLGAVGTALKAAEGKLLPGDSFESRSGDNAEAVHRAMVERRLFDLSLKQSVPHGRALFVVGFRRRLFFWRKARSVTAASVLAPPAPLLDGQTPPAVTRQELQAHLRELIGRSDPRVPHLVAVCSPSGFAPEVWESALELPNVKVVLVEPRGDGGWKVAALSAGVDAKLVRLFDPEAVAEKLDRVRREIGNRRDELLLSGMSASDLANRLAVPVELVTTVFAELGRNEPDLRVVRRSGEVLLYRGAEVTPLGEKSMSFLDRIKSLFSGAGEEAEKINHLIEKRTALSQRRDRIYEDVARLEKRESALVVEGQQSESQVARKRLAAQVVTVRKEIERWNTIAGMLNQQLGVINTDIHNLTLLQQGQIARLPSAEELTEHAVAAEEMLETLAADAKLVEGLEAGIQSQTMSDEELAVMAEFEKPAAAAATEKPVAAKSGPAAVPPLPQANPARIDAPSAE